MLYEERQSLTAEIKWIRHAQKCERCLAETCIGIERYGSSRVPWYLSVELEEFYWPGFYKDCPHVENFTIGNYWDRTEGAAIPFIKARLQWAEKILYQQRRACTKLYKILLNWK